MNLVTDNTLIKAIIILCLNPTVFIIIFITTSIKELVNFLILYATKYMCIFYLDTLQSQPVRTNFVI